MQPDSIIFVKHGDKYSALHVNRLYKQLVKYYPNADFYCYTENKQHIDARINIIPILKKPSLRFWWNKLAMFSKDFPVKGKCLFFDLDMDVKEDPSNFIKWNNLTVINAYWKKDMYFDKHAYDVKINSSVITWTAKQQAHIWDHFMTNRDYFMRKYKGIDRFLVHEGFALNTFADGIVNSVANENYIAPIDMYNGIEYELPRIAL
jgi:hypothetical protein